MNSQRLPIPLAIAAGTSLALVVLGMTADSTARPPQEPRAAKQGGGPLGPGGGPGFGPGTFLGPPIFEAADLDKDGKLTPAEASQAATRAVREADAEGKGSVDAQALARAINKLLGPPPGGEGDGPGPGGPPGGFGPGNMMAPRIVEAADTDKDGRLSSEEAARGAEAFVREADPNKAGSIDGDALAGAMNRRMGPPPGMGGPGGMMGAEKKILKEYDKSGDGRLDQGERQTARAALKAEREKAPQGGRGFGPPGGFPGGGRDEPTSAGSHVAVADARTYPGQKLYDPATFRTFFLDFEDADWETALEDFHATDVELPATLTVDGRRYPGVGVHFRGASSYGMVRAGHKRSFNVSVDLVDPKQRVDGYKTLNLLNAHEDSTLLHSVLYLQIARNYIPAPKANFVRVVVNGESWGVYTNAQQFDKVFLAENYPSAKGTRWKVRGNPGADGGLTYVGEDVAEYRKRYEIKTGDDEGDWKALINLCKILNETPADRLEAALKPLLDLDGVLKFLALDNALINNDGYWTRASDYSIYRDPKGVFHVVPHDANETLGPVMSFGPPGGFGGRRPGGPGGGGPGGGGPGGGPGGGTRPTGIALDPLIGLDDARKPLRSKLLAVPALRERYLRAVRAIAEDGMDWGKIGPIVARYRDLIGEAVAADTRKLTSTAAFLEATDPAVPPSSSPPGRSSPSLRAFFDRRRQYLLDNPAVREVKP